MKRVLALVLLPAFFPALAGAADQEAAFPVAPSRARISLSLHEGFQFLDGGYADPVSFYSSLWDTGRVTSLAGRYDFLPVLGAGMRVGFVEFRDSGVGIDDLHAGFARLGVFASLPLALPSRFLLDADAVGEISGTILRLGLEGGAGIVDPTHDAFGRIFQRTLTWSVAVTLTLEYRLDRIGFFAQVGLDWIGPPQPAPNRWQTPDSILSFPLSFGLSLHLP